MEKLFSAVRRACPPALWSQAVELARKDAVVLERQDAKQIEARVAMQNGLISPAVTFFMEDLEWACECPSGEDACVHVAAAAIALKQNAPAKQPQRRAQPPGRIAYRFTREGTALSFDREIVRGKERTPLTTTLAALTAQNKEDGPAIVVTPNDLEIEVALGPRGRGVLARELLRKLLGMLHESGSLVTLDGAAIKVGPPATGMVARVEDVAEGVRVRLDQERGISQIFSNGALFYNGETLRPRVEHGLTARDVEDLRRGRIFHPRAIGELVTDLLPRLRASITVRIDSKTLPSAERTPPRLYVDPVREGEDGLSVMGTLVYGDPPLARVDGDKLVHFGRGPVPVRDLQAEQRLLRELHEDLDLAPGVRRLFKGEAAVAWAQRFRAWHKGATTKALDAFRIAPPIVPSIKMVGDNFELELPALDAEGNLAGRAEAGALLRAWREGASVVPLLDGGFAPLPLDWLHRYGARVFDLLAARRDDGSLSKSAIVELGLLARDLGEPEPPAFEALRALVGGFDELPKTRLSKDIKAKLRKYQHRGVDWLTFLRRAGLSGLLADDMGLGKTLQAICVLQRRTLVVAPTSVLFNWKAELEKFRPSLKVSLYYGPGRRIDFKADVVLTTYALLRLDADKLIRERWDTVVLDEAQMIKNPDSQTARAAYQLKADFRLTLSGTPVENRLDELWSQFNFLEPGLLGKRSDFYENFVRPIEAGDKEAGQRLRERIKPFVLRRLKRDVAPELPPRTEVTLRCELNQDERNVYDAIRAATLRDVVQRLQGGGGVIEALEALLRLRQAASHSALVPGQKAESSSKIELLLAKLDEAVADGHKSLVFSQWTSMLDLLEPHLTKAKLGFTRLDGSTPDRGAVVGEFQREGGPPVMLLSLKAGGTGLNLTAADHVFLLDPWWNPAVEDQAADRAHRIGQDKPVMVYRLVAAETVEERILALQESKRAVAQAALSDAAQAVSLTRDDLLGLLQ